jgi:phosphoribosylanthranilate isomerase
MKYTKQSLTIFQQIEKLKSRGLIIDNENIAVNYMIIKVCGMKHPDNMRDLAELTVDMMGLIFYEKSPRYVDEQEADSINALSLTIPKVGVFVNASQDVILGKIETFQLQYIQLHGQESPEFCYALKKKGIPVIKAFQIKSVEDWETCLLYEGCCDYFLFDTPTSQYGGSGNKFEWNLISTYTGSTPFFLSGGIAPEDAEIIKQLNFPQLVGVDLNSRFEVTPGIKDINSIRRFLSDL